LTCRHYRPPGSRRRESIVPNDQQTLWIAIIGCLAGGLVGYLVGTPPGLSFGDVLTRGVFLEGINALARPAAEVASNYMLAGAVAGIVAGLGLASLMSNQGTRQPVLEAEKICHNVGRRFPTGCSSAASAARLSSVNRLRQCGKAVPPDQQFCGSCGTGVESRKYGPARQASQTPQPYRRRAPTTLRVKNVDPRKAPEKSSPLKVRILATP